MRHIITAGCFLQIFVYGIINPIIGGFLWGYAINHWLVFAGKEAAVHWWQGALISLVPGIGQLYIPAALITWILSLFGL